MSAKHATEYLGREKPWDAAWHAAGSVTEKSFDCVSNAFDCVSNVVHGEIYISAPRMNFSVALIAIALEYETANV